MATFKIPTASIDALNQELQRRAGTIGKGMKKVVEEESRPMLRDLVNLTPPRTVGATNSDFARVAPQSQRKQGMEAIEKDINRLFQPLDKIEAIYNPTTKRFADVVERALEEEDFEGLADILYSTEILPFKPKIISEADPSIHRQFRVKSTGHVSRSVRNPWLVVDGKSIDSLKKKLKDRVGYAKSGWMRSLTALGMQTPRWISKGGPGKFKPEGGLTKYYLTMGNEVPYMGRRAGGIVGEAIASRIKKLISRTEYLLKEALGN